MKTHLRTFQIWFATTSCRQYFRLKRPYFVRRHVVFSTSNCAIHLLNTENSFAYSWTHQRKHLTFTSFSMNVKTTPEKKTFLYPQWVNPRPLDSRQRSTFWHRLKILYSSSEHSNPSMQYLSWLSCMCRHDHAVIDTFNGHLSLVRLQTNTRVSILKTTADKLRHVARAQKHIQNKSHPCNTKNPPSDNQS